MRRTPADSLTIDGLTFAVRWSTRRRTIGITVARDGGLRAAAPAGLREQALASVLARKLPWVRRKLAEFAAQGPPPEPRALPERETLSYLGRRYRIVRVEADRPVRLRRGSIELAANQDGAAEVQRWYVERGQAYLRRRVDVFAPKVGATPARVVVRDLGKRRWGTCHAPSGLVTFHWQLMMQPPALVDYVVVHEIAHLLEPNHGPRFWDHVTRVLPDWRTRRRRLGAAIDLPG